MDNPTDQQLSAIDMVKNNQISILTGGPGTGKTFTTKIIIDWAIKNKLVITQAAPTGKAAKRMIEATGQYASTIHTMLGCMFEDDKFVFNYNHKNPIPTDLIILDEISMITNDLMARVMEAINIKRTKLLLIGDKDQLPSVGAGAVLRDLLASKIVPHVELNQIFRNSGSIVKICHLVKMGDSYQPHTQIDLDAESPKNLIHIECNTPEKTLAGIKKIVCERMPLRGYDPIEDVQVISPVNKKGLLSCESINNILRDELNPDLYSNEDEDSPKFRTGDKVINTKNSPVTKTNGKQTAIVNGDIGIVTNVSDKKMAVLFADPEREVQLPKNDKNLLHAYCITCHRFQGSEAPVIIIPVHRQFNYYLSNSWIYTALSRGKELVITVGAFDTIERAIRNKQPNNRETRLTQRLLEADQVMREKEFADI